MGRVNLLPDLKNTVHSRSGDYEIYFLLFYQSDLFFHGMVYEVHWLLHLIIWISSILLSLFCSLDVNLPTQVVKENLLLTLLLIYRTG